MRLVDSQDLELCLPASVSNSAWRRHVHPEHLSSFMINTARKLQWVAATPRTVCVCQPAFLNLSIRIYGRDAYAKLVAKYENHMRAPLRPQDTQLPTHRILLSCSSLQSPLCRNTTSYRFLLDTKLPVSPPRSRKSWTAKHSTTSRFRLSSNFRSSCATRSTLTPLEPRDSSTSASV